MNHQLPELPERDLPPGRHRLLKEHLLTEIRRTEEVPVRARSRWLRPALTAAAVATVAAVTFTLVPSSGDAGPRVTTAAAVLEDAALAAEDAPGYGEIRDDQFAYVETRVSSVTIGEGGKRTDAPLRSRETWLSVDGSSDGLLRDENEPRDVRLPSSQPGDEFYDSYAGYNHLKTLPTDPDAMYDWLRGRAARKFVIVIAGAPGFALGEDQAMLMAAGSLMENAIVPPAQAAALYRAVARIPGVTVDEDAVDALGRRGVGVASEDAKTPLRVEWIFDEKTHQLLGQRHTVTRDYGELKKGTVRYNAAIERRAFVDEVGRRP
jgi:hypothetical protein